MGGCRLHSSARPRQQDAHGVGAVDEFAAAFQFPSYFGENGAAFDECITDLGWLSAGNGYVVLISDPAQVLTEGRGAGLQWLIRTLANAMVEWATPIELGEWWDRPGTPFHVVLQSEPLEAGKVAKHWAKYGVTVAHLGDAT